MSEEVRLLPEPGLIRQIFTTLSEHRLLMLSVFVTAFFALLGVIYGLIFGSGMIFFDGLFSFISLGMSVLSVRVLREVKDGYDDARFPFGKAHFEPILIMVKSVVLGGACLLAIGGSLISLIDGGHYVAPLPAVIYGGFCTLSCAVMTLVMHLGLKREGSSILESERNEWWADALLSAGVFAGFAGSLWLAGGEYAFLVPYFDPLMVLLAACALIVLPVRTLISSLREMLFVRAEKALVAPVESEARLLASQYNAEYFLRMVKIGRELSIEVNFLMEDRTLSVAEMDQVRNRFADIAREMNKQFWVNVSFTREAIWT